MGPVSICQKQIKIFTFTIQKCIFLINLQIYKKTQIEIQRSKICLSRMGFFNKILKQVKQAKSKVQNSYQKIVNHEDPEFERYSYRNIDQKKDLLRSTLKFSTYAPLIIQSYIMLYGIYIFYTILKTIILAPLQILLGIFNATSKHFNILRTKYVTMHSLVIVSVSYLFTLNADIFDISFMYHLIRGQSTVKIYAIIFALQASQVVMTKLGVFLHHNIRQKLTSKDVPFYKLIPQFCVEFLYVFSHAYIIYIDYLIYSVVLNSSFESFLIFWSVVYLTKMKASPSFGLEINKYKATLTDDSKYRVSRIIYLILFEISQFQIVVPSLGYKLIFIIFVEEAFIIMKHMLYLLSSYQGAQDTSAIAIREEMYKIMYLDAQKPSIDRCVSQSFTVLPFAVFSIKIIFVFMQSNWKPNFMAYLTFYVIMCIVAGLILLTIVSIKFFEEMAHQMRKKQNTSTPFLNSICIDVIGRIIQESKLSHKNKDQKDLKSHKLIDKDDQKQENHHLNKSRLRLKKTTSFLQSLMLHANKIQSDNKDKVFRNKKSKNDDFDSNLKEAAQFEQEDPDIDYFKDEDQNVTIDNSKTCLNLSQTDLRKSNSHM